LASHSGSVINLEAETAVVDAEIVIQGHLERSHRGESAPPSCAIHADIDDVAPQISIAVNAKPVVATADQHDVTLSRISEGGRSVSE